MYLAPPPHSPRGPDGQGHNRMEIQSIAGAECALRPLTFQAMRETWRSTRLATYGNYGACSRKGACAGCPTADRRREMQAFEPRVLFRFDPRDDKIAWSMNHPGRGWSSHGLIWKWEDLAILEGWEFDGEHTDAAGRGFWMKATGTPRRGIYGL